MEDDLTYVLRKALRGLSLAPGEAAAQAGLPESEVMALLRGRFSVETARRIAPVLSLSPAAFAALPEYTPRPFESQSVRRIDIPFEDGQVNAWLIQGRGHALLFDTGFSDESLRTALDHLGILRLDATFVTHGHRDHVGGLAEAGRRGPPVKTLKPGETLPVGPLLIRAFDLAGHCDPAVGYHIDGLEKPVCVVGDALFAGSIGGCPPELYQTAIANLRRGVFTQPDETLLLPGHGPATTIGEERASNPFFP